VNQNFLVETFDKPISQIQLFNIIGLPVPIESIALDSQKTQILLPNTLNAGLYFLVLEMGETQHTEKIIIR
jgi:hypothetical protein